MPNASESTAMLRRRFPLFIDYITEHTNTFFSTFFFPLPGILRFGTQFMAALHTDVEHQQ